MEENLLEGTNRIRPLVLVVDDDSGLRESLRVILEEQYEVLDVPDGGAVLALMDLTTRRRLEEILATEEEHAEDLRTLIEALRPGERQAMVENGKG